MPEIEEILSKVEELREKLNKFSEDKSKNLTDPEIVSVSRKLDVLLNTYHELMMAKKKNFKNK